MSGVNIRGKCGWSEKVKYRGLPKRPAFDPNLPMNEIIRVVLVDFSYKSDR